MSENKPLPSIKTLIEMTDDELRDLAKDWCDNDPTTDYVTNYFDITIIRDILREAYKNNEIQLDFGVKTSNE